MGTTAEKLLYLNDTKAICAANIETKGVDVPAGATFREIAALILDIEGGGTPGGNNTIFRPASDAIKQIANPTTQHWNLLNEATPNDTTYIYDNSGITRWDLYTITGAAIPTGSIISKIVITARTKDSTGHAAAEAIILKTGGTIYEGSPHATGTSFADFTAEWTQNPATAAAWTISDILALQIGIKFYINTLHSCSQIYCTVYWSDNPGGGGGNLLPVTGQTASVADGDDGDLQKGAAKGFTLSGNLVSSAGVGIMFIKDVCQIFPGEVSGTLTGGAAWDGAAHSYARGNVANADVSSGGVYWQQNTNYILNDMVTPGSGRYKCKLAHFSSEHQPGLTGSEWENVWDFISTIPWYYGINFLLNDMVNHNGKLYKCKLAHTANNYRPWFSMNYKDKWDHVINYWNYGYTYAVGDALNDNYYPYRCILAHTSSAADRPGMGGNWQTYWKAVPGWQESTNYAIGDTVSYYNQWYDQRISRCKAAHYSSNYEPGMSMDWTTAWDKITTGTWYNETDYTDGDKVYAPNYNFYTCTIDHRSSNHYPGMSFDWATYWDNISVQSWYNYTSYVVGSRVSHYNGMQTSNFECIYDHTANYSSEPDSGGDWLTYWKRLPKAVICKGSHTSGAASEPYWGADWTDYWIPTPWLLDGYGLTTPAYYKWAEFISLCNDLNYGGFNDWRMPNLFELLTLLDFSKGSGNPLIPAGFAANLQSNYWTSTAYAAYSGNAWRISLYDGGTSYESITYPMSNLYCLPVRSL